jgi:hypothetical protein
MRKIQIAIVALCAVIIVGVASNVKAAAIGNTVWNDYNANGIQDEGEEGISDVKVKLYYGNKVETDKTNSEGRYKFKDLDDGHYTLIIAQETLPEGCYNTYDRDGNNDGKYEDKWIAGNDYFTHADFGYKCTTTYVSAGKISPITGPNTMIAILATAVAVGVFMFMYKRQVKKNSLRK